MTTSLLNTMREISFAISCENCADLHNAFNKHSHLTRLKCENFVVCDSRVSIGGFKMLVAHVCI